MSNSLPNTSVNGVDSATPTRLRRALLIDAGAAARLQPQLAVNGYETRTVTTGTAPGAIADFAPHVVLIELRRGSANDGNQDCLALARSLRAEPATYVLPLVFVFDEDERDLRNAALSVGADDYFSVWTPAAEMLARLDALFWRTEAGRRAASVAGDQRLEIDNFILMLDAVRAALRAGESGTLALVYASPSRAGEVLDKAARDRTLAEAHGFLKLNLRRVDEVTFYGPTTLLVYLPRTNSETAQAALSRLREQFIAERAGFEIALGLASFPADGDDVESLIEKSEAAALLARDLSKTERVTAYRAQRETENFRQLSETTGSRSEPAHSQQPSSSSSTAHLPAAPSSSSSGDEARQTTQPPLFKPRTETSLAREMQKVEERQAGKTGADEKQAFEKQKVEWQADESQAHEKKQAHERQAHESQSAVPSSGPSSVETSSAAHFHGADAVKAAVEAGARELERRAGGAIMPGHLLLTISNAARMAQINALIRSAGYEARAAFDGQQALDLLRIERPDLLLLDYQLHGMDGVETLRRLRKQSGGRLKLPVILLLPPDHELARQEALELGARDVVTTPYDPAELLTSVRLAGNAE